MKNKKIQKLVRSAKDVRLLKKHVSNNPHFLVRPANIELSKKVRKLQAEVYLNHGNVNREQINEHGFLNEKTDPYFSHSSYFVAEDKGEVVAGGRLILPKSSYRDLQIALELSHDKLPSDIKKMADSGRVCEMSGLVKKTGESRVLPLLLIREMYKYARQQQYVYILMSITEQPYKRFKSVFGEALIDIGEPYKIPHGNNIVHPCAIHVTKSHLKTSQISKNDSYTVKLIKQLMIS